MIEKLGQYRRGVVCDNCGDGFEAESFDEAMERIKDEGWCVKKEHGRFKHYCPECDGCDDD